MLNFKLLLIISFQPLIDIFALIPPTPEDVRGLGFYTRKLAFCYYKNKCFDKAIKAYNEVISTFEPCLTMDEEFHYIAKCYMQLGNCYIYQNNLGFALYTYNKANTHLRNIKQSNDQKQYIKEVLTYCQNKIEFLHEQFTQNSFLHPPNPLRNCVKITW